MGKVRAVANGNIMDEADVHPGLIEGGIYERIEDDKPARKAKAANPAAPVEVEKPKSTAVAPLTTADISPKKAPAKKAAAKVARPAKKPVAKVGKKKGR